MTLNIHVADAADHIVVGLKVRGIPPELRPLVDHVDQLEAQIGGDVEELEDAKRSLSRFEDATERLLAYWKLHGTEEWDDETWQSRLDDLEDCA